MKASELRPLPVEELQQKHDGWVEEYFRLRIKHSLGQLEDPLVLRRVRRDIARAKTLLVQRGVRETTRRRRRTTAAARQAGAADKPAAKPRAPEPAPAPQPQPQKKRARKPAADAPARPAQKKAGKSGAGSERGKG